MPPTNGDEGKSIIIPRSQDPLNKDPNVRTFGKIISLRRML